MWGSSSVNPTTPSRRNPGAPASKANSLPEEGESSTNHSKIVSSGVSTEKKGKAAFQEAVAETRAGDANVHIDNRTPSASRAARGGN